jgi:hypothetical protein
VDQKATGAALNFTGNYNRTHRDKRKMRLVFFQNAPKSGTIRVEKADTTWSYDYCHPNKFGSAVYAREYTAALRKCLGLAGAVE